MLEPSMMDLGALSRFRTVRCQRGEGCTYGHRCQFSHHKWTRRNPAHYKYKADLCANVKEREGSNGKTRYDNNCKLENGCPYAHSIEEQHFHPDNYKTTECSADYSGDGCPRGEYCPFLHVGENQREIRDRLRARGGVEEDKPVHQCATTPAPGSAQTANTASGGQAAESSGDMEPFVMDMDSLCRFRTVQCNRNPCHFGELCNFSHHEYWLRRNPLKFSYKEEMCQNVKEAMTSDGRQYDTTCRFGKNCRYAHSFEEHIYHPSVYKMQLCDYTRKGKTCKRGENCPYYHFEEEHAQAAEKERSMRACDGKSESLQKRSASGNAKSDSIDAQGSGQGSARPSPSPPAVGEPPLIVGGEMDGTGVTASTGGMSYEALCKFRTARCNYTPNCANGDKCDFSHCVWLRRNPAKLQYSAQLCQKLRVVEGAGGTHYENTCADGRSCAFAHSREEVLYHPDTYKTSECREDAANPGNCPRGSRCAYVHHGEEVRTQGTKPDEGEKDAATAGSRDDDSAVSGGAELDNIGIETLSIDYINNNEEDDEGAPFHEPSSSPPASSIGAIGSAALPIPNADNAGTGAGFSISSLGDSIMSNSFGGGKSVGLIGALSPLRGSMFGNVNSSLFGNADYGGGDFNVTMPSAQQVSVDNGLGPPYGVPRNQSSFNGQDFQPKPNPPRGSFDSGSPFENTGFGSLPGPGESASADMLRLRVELDDTKRALQDALNQKVEQEMSFKVDEQKHRHEIQYLYQTIEGFEGQLQDLNRKRQDDIEGLQNQINQLCGHIYADMDPEQLDALERQYYTGLQRIAEIKGQRHHQQQQFNVPPHMAFHPPSHPPSFPPQYRG